MISSCNELEKGYRINSDESNHEIYFPTIVNNWFIDYFGITQYLNPIFAILSSICTHPHKIQSILIDPCLQK